MKLTNSITVAAALLSPSFAAPVEKRQAAVTDADILQYALTVRLLFDDILGEKH